MYIIEYTLLSVYVSSISLEESPDFAHHSWVVSNCCVSGLVGAESTPRMDALWTNALASPILAKFNFANFLFSSPQLQSTTAGLSCIGPFGKAHVLWKQTLTPPEKTGPNDGPLDANRKVATPGPSARRVGPRCHVPARRRANTPHRPPPSCPAIPGLHFRLETCLKHISSYFNINIASAWSL